MEKDLWEVNFKRLRQKAVERKEWAYEFKEAKAVRRPQGRGVSKNLIK
jgi:hypothetical protein